MRCDGQMPCSACQERSKSCRYTDGRSRLSKAAPRIRLDSMPSSISSPRLLQTQDERQHDGDSQQQPLDGHAGPLLNETQEQPLDGLEGLLGQDQTEPHQIYTLGLPMDLDGIPWPWLHETSFLQDDPGLGDFGTVATHDYSAMLPAPESHDLCGDFRENDTVPDGQSHVAASSSHPVLEDARPLEAAEVDKLVHLASQPASGPGANAGGEDCFWDHVLFVATFIRGIATSAEQPLSAGDVFREHLQAYSTNFNRLWPMFVDSDIQAGRLHPILYLVQLSIGCMYGSPSAKHFGTLLHKSLRQLLTSFLAVESFDGDIIWLAHARLLTQVHGLYFGQPQGFSYAQHLGAVLVAQAKRLGLFQPTRQPGADLHGDYSGWKYAETRKRLALGVFRADVFTSVLLNTAPLLSFEEVSVTLPCSDDLWHNKHGLLAEALSVMINAEARQRLAYGLSDLSRILLDQSEKMPELDVSGYELAPFTLQSPIWKFSHDPALFPRLTGRHWKPVSHAFGVASQAQVTAPLDGLFSTTVYRRSSYTDALPDTPHDALGPIHRHMHDLVNDRARIKHALDAWHCSFTAARQMPASMDDRDTLMSSLLLWHTLNIQLDAPLKQLHDITYRAAAQRAVDKSTVQLVRDWIPTESAMIAVKAACVICEIIDSELTRSPGQRACFNFLAFSSLHHAAVILWTTTQSAEFGSFGTVEDINHSSLRRRSWHGTPLLCCRRARGFSVASVRSVVSHLGLPQNA